MLILDIYDIRRYLFFFVFWGVGGEAHVAKYQPDPKSLCSRRGVNSSAMSLHPLSIARFLRQKNVKKKISMNSDKGQSTFIFI